MRRQWSCMTPRRSRRGGARELVLVRLRWSQQQQQQQQRKRKRKRQQRRQQQQQQQQGRAGCQARCTAATTPLAPVHLPSISGSSSSRRR
jgi:hypothetical protein